MRAPERIFSHLVESGQEDYPFAFLATYATKDETGGVRHMPLQYALTEYGTQREKLLGLLACLNRVAEVSPLIGEFMEKLTVSIGDDKPPLLGMGSILSMRPQLTVDGVPYF